MMLQIASTRRRVLASLPLSGCSITGPDGFLTVAVYCCVLCLIQVVCYECLPVIGGVYAKSYDHTTLTTSR